jgi:hypothetical protein
VGLLLAVAAKCGALGDLRASLADLVFLGAFAAAYVALARQPWRSLRPWEKGLALLAPVGLLPLGLASLSGGLAYLAVCLYLLSALAARANPAEASELHLWVSALGLLALGCFLFSHSVSLWALLDQAFRRLSVLLHRAYVGAAVQLGPSYWAWELLLFYAALSGLRQARGAAPRRWWLTAAAVALPVLAVPLLYLAGAALVHRSPPSGSPVWQPLFRLETRGTFRDLPSYLFPCNVRLLVAGLVVAVELLLARRLLAGRALPPPRAPALPAALLAAGVLAAFLGLASWELRREATPRHPAPVVHFYDPHNSLLRPPGDAGAGAGYFAKLPLYLRGLGYQTRCGGLSRKDLQGCDVLVLINLPHTFPAECKGDILEFVRAGGGLLCLGDHTGQEDIREPFNHLLGELGIRFNFDSVCPLPDWAPGLLQFNPYLYADPAPAAGAFQTHAIGIGASLEVRAPARPVFVGRYGFSDPGNPDNSRQGWLGNLKYDYGEPLGDLVLAAEVRHGQGKIVVFGDTSTFQTSALCVAHNLAARTFAYLASDAPPQGPGPYVLLAGAVLLTAVLLRNCAAAPAVAVALLVSLYAAAETQARADSHPGLRWRPEARDELVFIDALHHSSYDLLALPGKGIGGLDTCLLRHNKTALFLLDDYARLPAAGHLFILAPNKPFTRREVEQLRAFLTEGGRVVIACGFEHREALRAVFEEFGIAIPHLPLGQFYAPDVADERRAWGAVAGIVLAGTAGPGARAPCPVAACGAYSLLAPPLHFRSGWPVDTAGGADGLCRAWGRDVVVRQRVGRGALVVVGDGLFFTEANLEGTRGRYQEGNVRFFKRLLEPLDTP